jgi:HAD superfamily hydrolase (TIGR01549 family)
MKIAAFVPLKMNSRRLPNKNFLMLGGVPLAYHIFESLSNVKGLSGVFCYTSQPKVLDLLPDEIELLMRPSYLDGDNIKGNELFRYAVESLDADIIVIAHATAPFLRPDSIEKGINAVVSGEYDCAFSVQSHQVYSWHDARPINYEPNNMIQTQDLKPILCETSGFYVFHKKDYLENGTRIGSHPCMIEVDVRESIDIDNPKDFNLATHMLSYDPQKQFISKDQFFVDLANANSKNKNIQHVSFDLDGVLIDSLPLMKKAWNHSMSLLGLEYLFDDYVKGVGMPFYNILEQMGIPDKYHKQIFELYNQYSVDNLEEISVTPGAVDQLKRLHGLGVKVSVVTSKNKARTECIIDQLIGREFIDFVVSPEDIPSGRGKPNPDPILLACTSLGADPYNTIYVGDMSVDKEAASRAGTHFVYANWGYGDLKKIKDVWFNNLRDMVDYIVQ